MNWSILTIDGLFKIFAQTFYLEPLMISLQIFFLFVAFTRKKNQKHLTLLKLYGVFAFLQGISFILLESITPAETPRKFSTVHTISTISFIAIEFVISYAFFYSVIKDSFVQKKLMWIGKFFLVASITSVTYILIFLPFRSLNEFNGYYSVITSFLILLPSFFYLFKLFEKPALTRLSQVSDFWIATGILLLHCVNIPLFLISHYFSGRFFYGIYSINYIAYSLLFIIFIKAVLGNHNAGESNTLKSAIFLK